MTSDPSIHERFVRDADPQAGAEPGIGARCLVAQRYSRSSQHGLLLGNAFGSVPAAHASSASPHLRDDPSSVGIRSPGLMAAWSNCRSPGWPDTYTSTKDGLLTYQ